MGFVIIFIIESCLTYVNEFKNKHSFSATSVYLSSIATSLVALASASIISTISAYTLGSLAHPSIASMASSSVTSEKMCLHECQSCGILCECHRRRCLRPFFSLYVHNCQQGSTMTPLARG